MAKHLAQQGYLQSAASLTGVVLENGLRRIATSRNIPSKIDQWAYLRNQAVHGLWEFTDQDVKEMHSGVTTFLEQYLAA